MISDAAFAFKWDGNDFLRLIVIERLEDEPMQCIGIKDLPLFCRGLAGRGSSELYQNDSLYQ
jgi:hypothetical protein